MKNPVPVVEETEPIEIHFEKKILWMQVYVKNNDKRIIEQIMSFKKSYIK